jgi:capsular polysaccharide biosynthesis protein
MNLQHLHNTGKLVRSSAARVSSLLPGSSIHFGPPRREATTSTAGDASAVVRHPLVPARTTPLRRPEMFDPAFQDWMGHPRQAVLREIFVAELPQGRYWGRYQGYVIDRNDTLLTDLSPTHTPAEKRHDALEQIKLPALQELRGTAAVINTLFSSNFHHWLLDTVPRFEWLRRAGFDLGKIDHFIFPDKLWRHHLETLQLLGIDQNKVICSHPALHVRADLLLAPSHSEPAALPMENAYTPEGLRFVRKLFLVGNPFLERTYPAKILVSREKASARRLVQAERANRMLFDLGFTKVLLEDHSLQEQAAMFSQARCVVMPTGGNLANFAFCPSGAVAIELFSPNYHPPFTYALLGDMDLHYYALVADKISRPRSGARDGNEDIDFDPDRLAAIVRQALTKFDVP